MLAVRVRLDHDRLANPEHHDVHLQTQLHGFLEATVSKVENAELKLEKAS